MYSTRSVCTHHWHAPHPARSPSRLILNAISALQLRVDVPPEPESSPEVRPYAIGTPLNPPSSIKLPYPVKLVPRQRNSYFVPHQSFSIMLILQNPMMLIMVFGGVMMLAMPYMMVRTSLICYLFFFSFFPSFLMWLLILRNRKTWTPEYCRKHSRTKDGLRMLCRAVI